MKATAGTPLLVGEVFVDTTITARGQENKLRLGGIAHAARGFWASGQPFRAAVIIPSYLEPLVRDYLTAFGCIDIQIIGDVTGAPNVTLIFDPTEIADQEYDTLLRDTKTVELRYAEAAFEGVEDALIFPGSFSLSSVCSMLPPECRLHLDVAYDVADPAALRQLSQPIATIFFSTSSPLLAQCGGGTLDDVCSFLAPAKPHQLIYKENRGGAQLADLSGGEVELLPAQLGRTVNSVGVGDVFAAAYVANLSKGIAEAGWRATYAAAAYSQTTEPDLFKRYVSRAIALSLDEMRALGGTSLPWHERLKFPIYLAAPDFRDADRSAIERALGALSYHNFLVRRPILENGELPSESPPAVLAETFRKDCQLLRECSLVFAVPTGRDPGTLVEIGIAIEAGIPVVVYDPPRECNNTMVMAGSVEYSDDLDICLNAVFMALSLRRDQ